MLRRSRRTIAGVTLGVLVSLLLRNWAPSVTFPRGAIVPLLLTVGFVIPDGVFDGIDYVLAVIQPYLIPVFVGTVVCVAVVGRERAKRGIAFGFLVASLVVAIPLAALIFVAFDRGLSFSLTTWFERAFIQPVGAVASGMLAGVLTVLVLRLVGLARRRASSSL
jgi:hypothetical protein